MSSGLDRIAAAFGRQGDHWIVPKLIGSDQGDQGGNGKPVRLRPGTPPLRDAEHARKHAARKRARASRRRNRV